jgi:hypothetical protein
LVWLDVYSMWRRGRYWESSVDVPGPATERLAEEAQQETWLSTLARSALEGRCIVPGQRPQQG